MIENERRSDVANGDSYDALVIGGGPAGSAAAIELARAGYRVGLFDAKSFPRDKICGDLVGTDAVRTLHSLGCSHALDDGFALTGARIYGPTGRAAGVNSSSGPSAADAARVIPRETFDARLVESARDAGTRIACERVHTVVPHAKLGWAVTTSHGIRFARTVIGADGYGSRVAAAIGRRPSRDTHLAIVIRAYATKVRRLGEAMHFFVNAPEDGYGWVFPLGEDRANIGLGFVLGDRPTQPDIRGAFARFVERAGPATQFLEGAAISQARVWPIPLGWNDGPVAAPGLFLAGDAASLASPLSGSGIHNALGSGRLAATAAIRHLRGDSQSHIRYARDLKKHFAPRLHVERSARAIVGMPSRIEPFLVLANALPFGNRMLSAQLLALG